MEIKTNIVEIPNEGTLKFCKFSENLMFAVPPFLSEAVIEPGNAIYIFLSTGNMTFKIFRVVEGLLVPLKFWVKGFYTINLLYSNLSKIAKFSPILRGFTDLMDSHSCSDFQQKEISGEIPLETQIKNRIKDINEVIEEECSERPQLDKLYTHWFSDNYIVLSAEKNPAKLNINRAEAIFLGCDNDTFSIFKMNNESDIEIWAYCYGFNSLISYAKKYSFVRKIILATKNLLKPETMQKLQEIEAESNE